MIHKFTLYCVPGRLFCPGTHYLILDEWLVDSSFLILAHGIISENEYRHILTQITVPIYQGVSYSWVGLYPAHQSKKIVDTQYAGDLIRISEKKWSGRINVG